MSHALAPKPHHTITEKVLRYQKLKLTTTMASPAASSPRYSHEAAVARTAVKLATKMCTVNCTENATSSVNLQGHVGCLVYQFCIDKLKYCSELLVCHRQLSISCKNSNGSSQGLQNLLQQQLWVDQLQNPQVFSVELL